MEDTMSLATARAVCLGLIGGTMAVLFYTQGLVVWAGFIAWASFLESGGDGAALKKTITGNLIGAVVGWVALVVMLYLTIPVGTWLWMPRTGFTLALALLVLALAANMMRMASIPSALYGFAAVLGVSAAAVPAWVSGQRLIALRQYNPVVATILSMVGGALCAYVADKLAARLAKT
jgi:hypothetical protein